MALIDFQNVCVDFPIYNADGRSIKKKIIKVATGGQLGADDQGRIVIRALENLTFTFKDGDRVGLLGHNGAGKSTLLRVLGRVYVPTSGTALTIGKLGSLIEISLGIDQEATGRENIYIRGAYLGMSRSEINNHLNNIIEFSELGNFIDMPLRTYSTGMQLRLSFSISTMVRHEILLMDEWLSVGDDAFKRKAEIRMSEVVQATNILVIASHSQSLLMKNCNRIIWLEHGKIKMDGDPASICPLYFNSPQ